MAINCCLHSKGAESCLASIATVKFHMGIFDFALISCQGVQSVSQGKQYLWYGRAYWRPIESILPTVPHTLKCIWNELQMRRNNSKMEKLRT